MSPISSMQSLVPILAVMAITLQPTKGLSSCVHQFMAGAHASGVYRMSDSVSLQCAMPDAATPLARVGTVVYHAAHRRAISINSTTLPFGIQYQLGVSGLRRLWHESSLCSQNLTVVCDRSPTNNLVVQQRLFTLLHADGSEQDVKAEVCAPDQGQVRLQHVPLNVRPNAQSAFVYNISLGELTCETQLSHLTPDCVFNFRAPTDVLSLPLPSPVTYGAHTTVRLAFRTNQLQVDKFLTLRSQSSGEHDLALSVSNGYFLTLQQLDSDRAIITVSDSRFLADGSWHSIELRVEGRSVIVAVDDQLHSHRAHNILPTANAHSIILRASPQAVQYFDVAWLTINGDRHCGASEQGLVSAVALCQEYPCHQCTAPLQSYHRHDDLLLSCPAPDYEDTIGYTFTGTTDGRNLLRLRLTDQRDTFTRHVSITFRTTASAGLLLWAHREVGRRQFATIQLHFNNSDTLRAIHCEKPSKQQLCQSCALTLPNGVSTMRWQTASLLYLADGTRYLAAGGNTCKLLTVPTASGLGIDPIYSAAVYESVPQGATFVGGVPLKRFARHFTSPHSVYEDDAWGTVQDTLIPLFKGCIRAVVIGSNTLNLTDAVKTTDAMFRSKQTVASVYAGCASCQLCASPDQCVPDWSGPSGPGRPAYQPPAPRCDCAQQLQMNNGGSTRGQCRPAPQHSIALVDRRMPVKVTDIAERLLGGSKVNRIWLSFRLPHTDSPLTQLSLCPWIDFKFLLPSMKLSVCLGAKMLTVDVDNNVVSLPIPPLAYRHHILLLDMSKTGMLTVKLDNASESIAYEMSREWKPAFFESILLHFVNQNVDAWAEHGCLSEFVLDNGVGSFDVLYGVPAGNQSRSSCGLRDLAVLSSALLSTSFGRVGPVIDVHSAYVQLPPSGAGPDDPNSYRMKNREILWIIVGVAGLALLAALLLTALCCVMRQSTRKKASSYQQRPVIKAHDATLNYTDAALDSNENVNHDRQPPGDHLVWNEHVARADALKV